MQENTDQRSRAKRPKKLSTSAWCSRPLNPLTWPSNAACARIRLSFPAKFRVPRDLVDIYRELARQTDQPLHLGLTEAGMGAKGLVWSAASMGILLGEGIGDTVRVSLTPRPGGDRREEVYAACELLQSLGLRAFAPSVTACPGCGRTTSTTFQELAESIQGYIRDQMPEWKQLLRRRRRNEACRDGLHRQRARRIEGCQYRHQPAGHRRIAAAALFTSTARSSPRSKAITTSFPPLSRQLVDDYISNKYPRRETPQPPTEVPARAAVQQTSPSPLRVIA